MLVGRITKLILVALLIVGLGAGVGVGVQPFAGTAHRILSIGPDSGDCGLCQDCAKRCVTSRTCGAQCISSGLFSATQGSAVLADQTKLAPRLDWQLSSAELRTPTPPPRLIHIA
jgi:hypothetical protein